MKRVVNRILASIALVAVGFAMAKLLPQRLDAQSSKEKSLPAAIVRADDAAPTRGDWGHWLRYFRGDTHGTRDMVVLAVTLKPGQAPHPPHKHAEEEFMILAEGKGTWHLDGKEHEARKGDVLYAPPWAMHGLKNTSDAPLTYYMFEWNNKGVTPPLEPTKVDNPEVLDGEWNSVDRHVAIASLFQPQHGVRKRDAKMTFKRDDDRLTGLVVAEDGQKGWEGNRTEFRVVTFAGGRLAFEYDITWRKEHGPLAVESGKIENKGYVKVEGTVQGDRIAGTWRMYLVDGTEVFRGEWEAHRAKKPAKE